MVATLMSVSMSLSTAALAGCSRGNSGTGSTTTAVESNIPEGDYQKPNIVFVLLDDTGAMDFGCYGNTFNETPNIDRVASEGVQFGQYYTQPVCSPSRSCLFTGMGTLRTGITNFLDNLNSLYLDNQEFTLLPQLLSDNGYRTGMIGKWHLCAGYDNYPTKGSPYDAGWDDVILSEQRYIGGGDYFYPYYHLPQVTDGKNGDYLIDVMNDAAVDYIKEAAEGEKPFFLYLSHYATHTTLDAPAKTLSYFQKKRGTNGDKNTQDRNPWLAAMLKHIDDGVGAIDKTLQDLGIADNTILIIASDNGGSNEFTDNGILRGGKSQLYEGGIRDPLIIRWPSQCSPKVEDTMVSVIDMYQTLSEAAGISPDKIPQNSGLSLLPLLKGTGTLDRDTLYWAFPRSSGLGEDTKITNTTPFHEGAAIRVGDYKYIESIEYYRRELYNLKDDPGEQNNIFDSNRELAESMAEKLHALLRADTVGKKVKATLEWNEYYRWQTTGSINKTGGAYKTSGNGIAISKRADVIMYDIDMSADVSLSGSGCAGVVFRTNLVTPDNLAFTGYAATICAKDGKVSLLDLKNGRSYEIASAKAEIEEKKTYSLRVVADGSDITIYLDGQKILNCTSELYLHGGVGFFSENASATLDNLDCTGIASSKTLTDTQKNMPTAYDLNIMVDRHYLRSQVLKKDETNFVNAEELLRLLSAGSSLESGRLSVTFNGNTAVFTEGSGQMILNGQNVNCAGAPFTQDGVLYIPLYDLLDALGVVYKLDGKLLTISSNQIEALTYTNSRIVYEGNWNDIGITMRSSEAGAYAQLTFTGSGIKLFLDRGTLACIFEVYLDGELVDTIDAWNANAVSRSLMFERSGLERTEHTIKVVNTGTHREGGQGTNLNITAFEINTGTSVSEETNNYTKVDFSNDKITYSDGNWSVMGETKRSSAKDQYLEYTFTGTSIEVYMGVGTGAGIFEVYLDDKSAETVDGYNANAATLMLYSADGLSEGEHTIRLVNTGTKNPQGTATNMNLAYFMVYR